MKMFWCSKCQEGIAKNARQQRPNSKGWVCPTCSTGLPRMPMAIIEEEETVIENWVARLRA